MGNRRKQRRHYVVWVGAQPGVYARWRDAEKQVQGWPGAKFKGFSTREDAKKAYAEGWEKHWGTGRVLPPNRKSHKASVQKPTRRDVMCGMCDIQSEVVDGSAIYPNRPEFHRKWFYQCPRCKARVGCHPDGRSLGTLAGSELRRARIRAHEAFDSLWKDGHMSRTKAYAWLAKNLGISRRECHIGQFDETQCESVVELVSVYHSTETFDLKTAEAAEAPY
ncbi:MAG: viroplasmin family protein [Planctomycetota bacterium]